MVKVILRLIIFYSLMNLMHVYVCAEPIVDASIDSGITQAHFPIEGTLTITHRKNEKIDPNSISMEGKPLEVLLVKETTMTVSQDTLVSIYRFELPAKEKGLYPLPSISIKINDKTYHTIPSSYQVQEADELRQTDTQLKARETPTIFKLEGGVKGPLVLYPGERTQLFYRISYNRNIDLTRSDLPFIHPPHFKKVGDVQIQDLQQKNVTIQNITQEIEAFEVGNFRLGPSSIEGYAYTTKAGKKVYDPTLLHTELQAVTIDVKPFPLMNQPASFTGALGKIKGEIHLLTPSAVEVGNNVEVQINIQGVSNLLDLRLPFLGCQPGFSGFFQMNDLPPVGDIVDQTKQFRVELRPMTALIDEIPSIELSSFDSSTGKYIIQKMPSIPLKVSGYPFTRGFSQGEILIYSIVSSSETWPKPIVEPLDFRGIPVDVKPFKVSWISNPSIVWMIPFGAVLLLMQQLWYEKRHRRDKEKPSKKSETMFLEALKLLSTDSNTLQGIHLLERAFWMQLWERGIVPEGSYRMERLEWISPMSSVFSFIYYLQELQYSKNKQSNVSSLMQKARELFYASSMP